jgi:uncharacterized membrane protein YphA (DoxX/SURF4 family)
MTATEGIVVLLGRVLFAVFFIRSGIAHVRKHEGMTGYARSAGSRSLGSAAGRPVSGSWRAPRRSRSASGPTSGRS